MILEMDGPYWHNGREGYDLKRDNFARSQGFQVLRFKCAYATPQTQTLLRRFLIRKLRLNEADLDEGVRMIPEGFR